MDRVIFMGTPRFGQIVLDALMGQYDVVAVVTSPDRRSGRGRKVSVSPVKTLALAHNSLVLQPPTLKGGEIVRQLRDLAPAVIVVAAYGQILPSSILVLPKHQCINVHASLLPRFRGAAPIPAAILAGDEQTGVTLMLMDEGLDTGAILAQATVDITPDDTTASLSESLGHLGAKLLLDTLPLWLAGEITPQEQDSCRATCTRLLSREDGRIRWTEPAVQIERRCRAFYPWPGAFTFWDDRELKVLDARALSEPSLDEPPGKVVRFNSETAVVTGDGLLVLEKVQLSGRRSLSVEAFVCGQRDFVGSVLH
jgi:methionyl-tRNA formyltransferase